MRDVIGQETHTKLKTREMKVNLKQEIELIRRSLQLGRISSSQTQLQGGSNQDLEHTTKNTLKQ